MAKQGQVLGRDGKVELACPAYAGLGVPAHPTWRGFSPRRDFPLLLVTPHARYRINSQFANEPWFAAREPQVLWVHPTDAAARGLAEARDAEIRSPDGTVRAPVHVTEAIMPGVVCLNAGAWPAIGQEAGAGGTAGAANWLTSTEPTTPSQGSRTHSVAVQVSLPAEA